MCELYNKRLLKYCVCITIIIAQIVILNKQIVSKNKITS